MSSIKLIHTLLNWLFPQSEAVQSLEYQSAEYYYHTAATSLSQAASYIYSVFSYKDPLIQQAIWELKYRGNTKIAHIFGEILFNVILEKAYDEHIFSALTNPILIPLPISTIRRKERGWNQSELLCKDIITFDHSHILTYEDKILIKTKHTQPQTKLSRKERLDNLQDCFSVQEKYKEYIKGKDVVLIDDITTTGSTISEARKTLIYGGARSVIAVTIAH